MTGFSKHVLDIDVPKQIEGISAFIRRMVLKEFKRRGAVIGLSGGIDSAVVAQLCVHALGRERVLGLFLPEKESNPASLEYGMKQAKKMGIDAMTVDITKYLTCLGVYENRNAIIKRLFPEFDEGCRFHITLPQDLLERDRLNYRLLTVESKDGTRTTRRIAVADWLEIAACQNMKQRTRMIQLYYHAEKNNCIVAGTTNKSEVIGGFFVKFGDGGVDIEPIAHLYKRQVYALAHELDVVKEIIDRPPSPDTYSLPVTDKEFYFCLDYNLLDLLLYAHENRVSVKEVAREVGLGREQVERVFRDIGAKERVTWHLRQLPPSLEKPSQ